MASLLDNLKRKENRYALLLFIAPFLLFWQLWWPFSATHYGFDIGDFTEQHVAMRTFVVSELHHGRLPFWDPYTFAGEPAVADPIFSTYYPPSLWQLLFPPSWMYWILQIEALLHAGLAGLFTFLAVRRLTGSARAGMLAGLAFSLSGYLTSYPMLQIIILQSATWLPAAIWALDVTLEERSWRHAILASLFLGCSILAGHPQTSLYVAYALAAYLVWRTMRLRVSWHFLARLAILLTVFGLGLSAAQWVPSLQILPYSPRAVVGYDYISNGFRLRELLGFVRPNAGHQWSPLYVGILTLIFALWALVRGRKWDTWFWGGVAGIALLLSMGRYGPLFSHVYRWMPGLTLFREQERWALVTVFSIVVLAGYGYAQMERQWPSVRRAFWFLAFLIFLDLFHANSGVILQPIDPRGPFVASSAVRQIRQATPVYGRVSSEGLLPGGANAGLVFHVRDVVGSGPLYQKALDEFVSTVPELRWWQMLDVRHVLTRRVLHHGALLHVLSEGDVNLYQTFIGARTAWLAHGYIVSPSQDEAIRATARPDLDPFRTVVLEHKPLPPLPQSPVGKESLRITAFEKQRIAFEAVLTAPGILVASEMWYPGWEVYIDGKRGRTLRAYGILRAVALPAGKHEVEWRFEPSIIWAGLVISMISALAAAIAFVYLGRRGVPKENT